MAAAGRSMTPFYIGLGLIGLVGVGLIVSRLGGSSGAPLSISSPAPLSTGPRGIVLGPDSARVEVMEFSDFECPFCARFAVVQMPDIRQRLIETGRVRWRFVHHPLNFHVKGPEAHLAAACANRQGRFWELKAVLFQNQDEWVASRRPAQVIDRYAERTGLAMDQFRQCVSGREAWGDVLGDKAFGDSIGVTATPTFLINGRHWEPNAYTSDALRATVDSLLAVPAPAAAPRD